MDKSQADAIIQAMLEPDIQAQEDLRRKRAREAWWLLERRKVAWLALTGFPVGAAVTIYTGHDVTTGALWGALSGGAAGWLWVGWRSWRRAA